MLSMATSKRASNGYQVVFEWLLIWLRMAVNEASNGY